MTEKLLGDAEFRFEFDDQWSKGDHHKGTTDGWAHHGIAVTNAGEVYTFDEQQPLVQVLSLDGELLRTFGVDLVEGHGMALVEENGEQFLWISDIASKMLATDDGGFHPDRPGPFRGAAVKFSLDGTEVFRITTPDLPMYVEGSFCPTQVAVDEKRFGGSGDIWVADCYGEGVVHRFDEAGTYLTTLTGEEGAGRFVHPHAVYIDRRGESPELYVTDRMNQRIAVYDLQGKFLRTFGEEFLLSPSGFAPYGDNLLVTELDSRIAVLGPTNELLTYIGQGSIADRARPGWPNAIVDGHAGRPPLSPNAFNTPHGIAVDSAGNLYVSEWLIGGRLVKLTHEI